jgi:ribosomal-protein-alanine N-acetyltransferase
MNTNFIPFPELETSRTLLRKLRMEDVYELYLLRSNPVVMKYVGRPRPKNEAEVIPFLERVKEPGEEAIMWGITLKGNDKVIGTICYWNIDKPNSRAETGYMMMPEHYGKGIMDEVLKAVIAYGFKNMDLHSIVAFTSPQNEASKKLLERNHFVQEGHFREDFYFEGKYLSTAVYALLEKDLAPDTLFPPSS